MELPKTTPFDKMGHTVILGPLGPGWMVTSGNISTDFVIVKVQ